MTTRIPLPAADICGGCSACCDHIGLPPFEVPNPDLGFMPRRPVTTVSRESYLADLDIFLAMPAAVRADHAALVLAAAGDQSGRPCAWLDPVAKRCRHYAHRPTVCREWVPGAEGCCAARSGRSVIWRGRNEGDDFWNPLLPDRGDVAPEAVGDRQPPGRLSSLAVAAAVLVAFLAAIGGR